MFVKLTDYRDGKALYLNANMVSGIWEDRGITYVYSADGLVCEVEESAQTAVKMMEKEVED